jgi:hypothetical protein
MKRITKLFEETSIKVVFKTQNIRNTYSERDK